MAIRLSALLDSFFSLSPSLDCEIFGLAQNSQAVLPGYLFLACRGRNFDGRFYMDEAISKGAAAVLAETDQPEVSCVLRNQVPVVNFPRLSSYLPELAAQFFDYPAEKLKIIGVTGTNGKTSISQFLAQALQTLNQSCALVGTLGAGFPGALQEIHMTTPDTVTLQALFSYFLTREAAYVAMEVSSHSLDQKRIEGLAFEMGIFTNLTQDHLDYHGDMKAYAAAKRLFFTDYPMRQAVINADDPFGQELLRAMPKEKALAYSLKGALSGWPTVYAEKAQFELSGIRAEVYTPWGQGELFAPLVGEFNLSNLLAVLATLCSLGQPFSAALESIRQLRPVPGRMQIFGGGNQPWIVIDYSHTPDSLEKALKALRSHCKGTLYCLMGCGGDRDKGKRPLMGGIAEQYADVLMITSDNPRHEDPKAIIAEILGGLKKPGQAQVQPDRSQAIQEIIQSAAPGDYVLVAGKGAETYQQIGDEKRPFSDAARVKEVLEPVAIDLNEGV